MPVPIPVPAPVPVFHFHIRIMLHVTPSKLALAHLTGCPGSDSKTRVEGIDGRMEVTADNSRRYPGKYREKDNK